MRKVDLNAESGHSLVPQDVVESKFGDPENFIVAELYTWKIGNSPGEVKIPPGFITDYASIPSWASRFGFPKRGPYDSPAAIHDYFYWTQKCTRKQADNLMLIAMKEKKEDKIPASTRNIIYISVRLFGWWAWCSNARAKKKGYIKILPADKIPKVGHNTKWTELRRKLRNAHVEEPAWPDNGAYANYGDSTEIPETGNERFQR